MDDIEYIFHGTPEQFCTVAESYAVRYNIQCKLIHAGNQTRIMRGNRFAVVNTASGIMLDEDVVINGVLRADGVTSRLEVVLNPESSSPHAELWVAVENFFERLRRDGWEIIPVVYPVKAPAVTPPVKKTPQAAAHEKLTDALQDLIHCLEQGLERSEARRQMSISENGLKTRLKRLREIWNMPEGSRWADYVKMAQNG